MDATLQATVIGGLLATIPLLLGLIVQIYLHRSDIRQKDREAKTQLVIELMRNDIHAVEETIDGYLRILEIVKGIVMTASGDKIEQKKAIEKVLSMFNDNDSEIYKLDAVTATGERIAYSLGEEFYSEYQKFRKLYSSYHSLLFNPLELYSDKQVEQSNELTRIAGRCHTLLREKLISLRDTIK